jgi:hypothetical protein
VLIFLYAEHKHNSRTYRYFAPANGVAGDKFQIWTRFPDGFNYRLRRLHYDESGRLTSKKWVHGKFCPGFMPPFSAGETLTRLEYEDLGSCWFIEADGLGYDFELDKSGHDSLSPNCHEASPIVLCNPVLNEATFPEEN